MIGPVAATVSMAGVPCPRVSRAGCTKLPLAAPPASASEMASDWMRLFDAYSTDPRVEDVLGCGRGSTLNAKFRPSSLAAVLGAVPIIGGDACGSGDGMSASMPSLDGAASVGSSATRSGAGWVPTNVAVEGAEAPRGRWRCGVRGVVLRHVAR